MGYCMEDLCLHETVLLQQDMEFAATKISERKYKLIANQAETTKKKVRNGEGIHRNLAHAYVLKLIHGDCETMKWARMQTNTTDRLHAPYIQSHLNFSLLDVEDDSVLFSSIEQNVSLEDYLRGRWSRSSSFD